MQIKRWMTHFYELAPSTYKPGRIDHVYNANIFLKNFKQANGKRLGQCVTHREYVWSVREKTPVRKKIDMIQAVFRIHRIHMFLGYKDPDPLVRSMDPDPSIIKQK
jgi:hypothetical protein